MPYRVTLSVWRHFLRRIVLPLVTWSPEHHCAGVAINCNMFLCEVNANKLCRHSILFMVSLLSAYFQVFESDCYVWDLWIELVTGSVFQSSYRGCSGLCVSRIWSGTNRRRFRSCPLSRRRRRSCPSRSSSCRWRRVRSSRTCARSRNAPTSCWARSRTRSKGASKDAAGNIKISLDCWHCVNRLSWVS